MYLPRRTAVHRAGPCSWIEEVPYWSEASFDDDCPRREQEYHREQEESDARNRRAQKQEEHDRYWRNLRGSNKKDEGYYSSHLSGRWEHSTSNFSSYTPPKSRTNKVRPVVLVERQVEARLEQAWKGQPLLVRLVLERERGSSQERISRAHIKLIGTSLFREREISWDSSRTTQENLSSVLALLHLGDNSPEDRFMRRRIQRWFTSLPEDFKTWAPVKPDDFTPSLFQPF